MSDIILNSIPYFADLGFKVFLNFVGYYAFHIAFSVYFDEDYTKLAFKQKAYILKNVTKSVFLMYLVYIAFNPIIYALRDDIWDNTSITYMGNIYVSTDLSGLLFVPELPITTKLHHLCVLALGVGNIFLDYSTQNMQRYACIYAYFSVIPYCVNTYLGMRVLLVKKPILKYICKMSLYIYSGCFLMNVLFQHNIAYHLFIENTVDTLYIAIYLCIFYLIMIDDIKLIKYFYYKNYLQTR